MKALPYIGFTTICQGNEYDAILFAGIIDYNFYVFFLIGFVVGFDFFMISFRAPCFLIDCDNLFSGSRVNLISPYVSVLACPWNICPLIINCNLVNTF